MMRWITLAVKWQDRYREASAVSGESIISPSFPKVLMLMDVTWGRVFFSNNDICCICIATSKHMWEQWNQVCSDNRSKANGCTELLECIWSMVGLLGAPFPRILMQLYIQRCCVYGVWCMVYDECAYICESFSISVTLIIWARGLIVYQLAYDYLTLGFLQHS